MKKCVYCGALREDHVEKCCGLSNFTQIEDVVEMDTEEPLVTQPAAHELLKELCEHIDLDDLEKALPKPNVPKWIEDIPYDNIREQAYAAWKKDNPTLVSRIKKYLEVK